MATLIYGVQNADPWEIQVKDPDQRQSRGKEGVSPADSIGQRHALLVTPNHK